MEFDTEGSLPTTYDSQGSNMGLCGGLLGWDADDARLPRSAEALNAAGVQYRGIMVQGNEQARAQLTAWMEPFRDFGMTLVGCAHAAQGNAVAASIRYVHTALREILFLTVRSHA